MAAGYQKRFICTRGALRAGVLLLGASLSFLMLVPSALGQTPPWDESPSTRIDQADKLIRQGKTTEAIALLDPLAQKKPPVPGVETLLGRAYFTNQTYQQAILHLH